MSPSPNTPAATETARVRRAPKYPAFMIVGGGVAALATFVLTNLFPVDPNVGFWALFGYFALFGIPVGVVLGAVLALVLDRVATKRAKEVQVEITEERVEPEA